MTDDERLVERALGGNRKALEELVKLLTPVIQARAARVVWKYRGATEPLRQDVHDATQDVFAKLFAENGKILRDWDPGRGLSLRNFVGLVAIRQVLSKRRANGATMEATESIDTAVLPMVPPGLPESRLCDVDLVVKLLERFRGALSALGFEIFERLYLREQTTEQIEQDLGLSA